MSKVAVNGTSMVEDILLMSRIPREDLLGVKGSQYVIKYREMVAYCLKTHYPYLTMEDIGKLYMDGKPASSIRRLFLNCEKRMEDNETYKKQITEFLTVHGKKEKEFTSFKK